ncbi:MAG: HEAT repeat domain-containing protein [Candidatus Nanopelagicales bacterium]
MPLFGPPNVSKLAAKSDLKGLIKALGYQRDWLVRRQAVEALKAIGDSRAIEALIGALGDSNSTVRDEAAQALAALGVSSVEPLVETPSVGVSGASDSEADDVRQPGNAQTVEASPAAPVEPATPKMAAGRARTFRLFVSSTFNDFELERDTLRERVWPRLEQYCEQRGARFQAVDLRWGVGSEAAADQQTMNICLGEIERCHRVTPRPNFLILVGDHYGWLPLPPQIPAEEFDTLARHLSNEDRALADGWYELDDNARPSLRRLRPRRDESKQDDVWATVEDRLHPALQKAAEKAGLQQDRARVYRTSATEQEIVAGAFEAGEPDQVVCVLRHFDLDAGRAAATGPAEREKIAQFVDADPAPIDALRAELRARLPDRIVGPSDDAKPGAAFILPWGDSAAELDYLNGFADRVAGMLEASIDAELREPRHRAGQLETPRRPLGADELLDVEGWAHHDFAEDRTRFFVGRQDELARIDRYVDDNEPQPLVVIGGGGTGKSALTGEAVRRTLERHHHAIVVYRFIGATPGSSDGRTLLESICQELARRSGTSEQDVPSDFGDLSVDFRTRLEPPAGRQVIVFIDSLDQLGASDSARGLAWIPGQLPAGARLVVSTRPGETLDPLSGRAEQVGVPPLPVLDARAALDLWLDDAGRMLHDPQPGEVLDAFERSQGNPLYLRLAFEEARRWPFPEPPYRLHLPLAVRTDGGTGVVQPIIRDNLLARLETEHGKVLIAHALGYLGASRYGLAEHELIDLLSADPEVYRSFLLGSYHLPSDLVALSADPEFGVTIPATGDPDKTEARAVTWLTEVIATARDGTDSGRLDEFLDSVLGGPRGPKLPVVLWSRLFFDLEPYLVERQVENVIMLDFYHRELRDVTAAQYAHGEPGRVLHERLARYFHTRADPDGQGSWQGEEGRVDRRGLAELAYHLTCAQRWDDVYQTLTDFTFLERKAAHVGGTRHHEGEATVYTGVFRLQDDFDLALARMPGGGESASRSRLIATAVDLGEGLVVRCPRCNTSHPFRQEWQGQVITCPTPGCGCPLKINPFVVERTET